jgi:glycosyltransferase involved in cell wall biosynthesis
MSTSAQATATLEPVVSVVTIFLNAATYFEEAIASVLAQTDPRWELLLVDDGSTDGSTEIAERHARARPGQIKVLTHPGRQNLGMSASRNAGLRAARGAYVAFLDADDVWLPAKLERQLAAFAAHPEAALVYGPTLLWYSWTGEPADHGRDRLRILGVPPETLVQPPTLIPSFLRETAQTPSTCGLLVRREAALAVDGFEEAFRGMFEDQVFLYKLLLRYPAWVTGECLDRYRQHPGSHSVTARRARTYHYREPNIAQERFLAWLDRYLTEVDLRDADVRAALRDASWPYRHPVLARLDAWLRSAAGRLRRRR